MPTPLSNAHGRRDDPGVGGEERRATAYDDLVGGAGQHGGGEQGRLGDKHPDGFVPAPENSDEGVGCGIPGWPGRLRVDDESVPLLATAMDRPAEQFERELAVSPTWGLSSFSE